MTSREDTLFGQIALELGLVTRKNLEEALLEQGKPGRARLLGAILLERGTLDEGGLREILRAQREKLQELKRNREWKRDDASFGSIAVELGVAERRVVDDGLVEQFRLSKRGLFLKLGEILVARGKITEDQVLEVLRVQRERFATCHACGTRFRVLLGKSGDRIPCAKCGAEIVIGYPPPSAPSPTTPPTVPPPTP